MLVLGLTSAAVAESGPGHVLYGARLALETLVLPNRDSQARLGAQLARLNLRVREATEAVEGRDEHALGAALAAYREALAEVAELAPRYLAARASVAPALAANLSVLEALERRLGARSPSQLDLTIDATRRAYFASLPALPVNSHELSPHHAGRSAATPTLSVAAQAGWFVRRSEGRWATDDALK